MKNTQKINKLAYAFIFLLSINFGFSQKIVDSPIHGMKSIPGEITKIEILEDATVLHFTLYGSAGTNFSIPKGSCIKDVNSDEKLFVTKAEGVELNKGVHFPVSGVFAYKLFFPSLNKDVGKIDFIESNKGGNWYVNDIILDEIKYSSLLPKVLNGNWLKTDGSNAWAFSFRHNIAILDKEIWNYKSVDQKKKSFIITLEKGGNEKVVYAKLNKDTTVGFGPDKKQLENYSTIPTNNKNLDLPTDKPYEESKLVKMDSAIYSGVISNFDKRSKQKTGTIHVNNIFTGNQDSYLVKVKEDGSFSVKFPLCYPQELFVKLPGYTGSVFVEQGKETWQLINSSRASDNCFAGDLTQLNIDLAFFQFFNYDRSYYNLQRKIKEISIEEYKERSIKIHEKQLTKLDSILATRFVSNKAQQILKLKLDYQLYTTLLRYDSYNRGQEPQIDNEYMSFLTPEIYNNKLAVLAYSYSSFVNALAFSNAIRMKEGIRYPEGIELAKMLKTKGIELTEEEQKLIDDQIKFNTDNAVALQKQEDFDTENKEILRSFNRSLGKVYQKLPAADRKKIFSSKGINFDTIIVLAKSFDIVIPEAELAAHKGKSNVLTVEEEERKKAFYTPDRMKRNQTFSQKYTNEKQEYIKSEIRRIKIENITQFFGNEGSWMEEVLITRAITGSILKEIEPLSDVALKEAQKNIKDSFLASYLVYENNRGLAKIEANKSATGYVVNETPNTESDKIFDAIIDKYKGKVVFVDFWATWCGPCRSGMKKMIPLKEELKDKDVVFVYITNPSSPEKTYENMIPGIKGEHYRVSQDDWNYLGDKFNITGIPHYTLVNKEGKVVKDNTSDLRNLGALSNLFDEYLSEEYIQLEANK